MCGRGKPEKKASALEFSIRFGSQTSVSFAPVAPKSPESDIETTSGYVKNAKRSYPDMRHLEERYKEVTIPSFKGRFGITNSFAVPRIVKVVVNAGIGRIKDEREREDIKKALEKITGQAVESRQARIAIASFKTRVGMIIGYRVTLRGKRMYDFLERLVFAAIPRMRDFRGIKESAIDEHGNLNIGIREHIIFPEMVGEDVRKIFGLEVAVVTNAGEHEKARALFESLGFPLARK